MLLLWFDEKTGIKTSFILTTGNLKWLWFDEKTGIKTSGVEKLIINLWLWFDEKTRSVSKNVNSQFESNSQQKEKWIEVIR